MLMGKTGDREWVSWREEWQVHDAIWISYFKPAAHGDNRFVSIDSFLLFVFVSFFFCSNQHDLKCNWLNKPLQWSEIILFTALVFVQEWIQLVLEPSLFTCQLENWFFRNFTRLSSFYPNFILPKAPPKNPKNPQRQNLHDSENLPNFHPHTLYKDLHFKARPVAVRNRP